jgi:trans-2,3-dihydro-3-hydroxyanthranilate isomerase
MQVGPIQVDLHRSDAAGGIERIVMSQKKPQFLAAYEAAEIAPVFHLQPEDLLPGAPIQTVSTGTPQLMIPLRSHDALRRARVDIPSYLALRSSADFFSPHLFCLQGVTPAGCTFSRHFGTPPDTFEDPFTGSATGGMAAYLWHYGLLDEAAFIAEQGHWMDRPGQAWVEVVGPPEEIETVRVGGQAAVVLKGELVL